MIKLPQNISLCYYNLFRSNNVRSGLTLLELIVVLVILTTLGTVMLTQTAGLTGQARYDQTVRTLEQLQDAVIGRQPYAGEDPTSVPPGFVADIGRLPQAGSALNLAELWDREATSSPPTAFALQTLTGLDDDLQLACGWRGPYIRLAVGADELRNGWGQDFSLSHSDGTAVNAASDDIGAISSTGSGAGDSFDITLDDVVFTDSSSNTDLTTGQITFQFEYTLPSTPSITEYAVVRLYGPVNGSAAVTAQSTVITGTPGSTQSFTVNFSAADIPIGPKLLRAYQLTSAAAPATTADLTSLNKSLVRRVTVLAGGATWPNLTLEGQ